MSDTPPRHRNDIYGDESRAGERAADAPAIPAATVVLLRDADELEVLMVHKTSKIAFGGMWVFPGGRIDPEDYPPDGDVDEAARRAAARETREEAGLEAAPEDFVWFAHWTPPPTTPRRFATWFFMSRARHHQVQIDGGEIQDHAWLTPAEALARHGAGEIDLAPPTWVTLHGLSRHPTAQAALAHFADRPPEYYQTRIAKRRDGVRVALWLGDAGYDAADADAEGPRHRLILEEGGFVFERS